MRTVALAILASLATACASSTTPVRHYLMRSAFVEPSGPVATPTVGLSTVVLAPYLDRPGLVLGTAPYEIRAAQHHRWAEPLADGIRATLRAELSRRLGASVSADRTEAGSWARAFHVKVEQLHGTTTGEARLVAGFRITRGDGGETLASHRFDARQPLAAAGHAALVEAETALVARLADAMAQALAALPQGAG